MNQQTVLLFTRSGLGHAPEDLQQSLAVKFLSLLEQAGQLPAKILFYTDGVKLTCQGSPALEILRVMEAKGVEIEAMQKADKVISL